MTTRIHRHATADSFVRVRMQLLADERLTLEHLGLMLLLLSTAQHSSFEQLLDDRASGDDLDDARMLVQDLCAMGYVRDTEDGETLHVYDRPISHEVEEYMEHAPPAATDGSEENE
ncbi:MAG: hypothetical protein U5L04_01500 [Trueperaceae bacterium]|nr:hypothetical protein [Trueperaceae bacterium]